MLLPLNKPYYHPSQLGSATMQAVLPALTGRGYEGLAIQKSVRPVWNSYASRLGM